MRLHCRRGTRTAALTFLGNAALRDLWKLIAQTSVAKMYWLLISLLTTFITARYLGASGRGVVAAASTWVTLFTTFGSLSLSQATIYHATGKPREEWLPQTVGTMLAIIIATAVVGWLVVLIGYAATGGAMFHHLDPRVLLVAFAALPFMLWIESGNSMLIVLQALSVINIAQIGAATLSLLLVFWLVGVVKWGVIGAIVATVAYQVVIGTIGFAEIRRRATHMVFDATVARRLLSSGLRLHINAIAAFMAMQANILIINQYRVTSETGWYHLALQLITAVHMIPTAVSMVSYGLLTADGPDAAWPQHRKLLFQSLLVITVISVACYALAPFIILTVAGPAFAPAVAVFRILLLSLFGMTFSVVMSSQWITRGFFGAVSIISLAIAAVSVSANYFVIPRYGMYGAAWVTVGVYSTSILVNGAMAVWVERRVRRLAAAAV